MLNFVTCAVFVSKQLMFNIKDLRVNSMELRPLIRIPAIALRPLAVVGATIISWEIISAKFSDCPNIIEIIYQ